MKQCQLLINLFCTIDMELYLVLLFVVVAVVPVALVVVYTDLDSVFVHYFPVDINVALQIKLTLFNGRLTCLLTPVAYMY